MLDISGFDPPKVGIFDTAAQMAAALIFDKPVHAKTRKSFGEMTRKLSVTASQ
jgi:hypothetical protein